LAGAPAKLNNARREGPVKMGKDINRVIGELKRRRQQIDRVITAFEKIQPGTAHAPAKRGRCGSVISIESCRKKATGRR
jgi:hypothetical protein